VTVPPRSVTHPATHRLIRPLKPADSRAITLGTINVINRVSRFRPEKEVNNIENKPEPRAISAWVHILASELRKGFVSLTETREKVHNPKKVIRVRVRLQGSNPTYFAIHEGLRNPEHEGRNSL
jgi:hypothetical protein